MLHQSHLHNSGLWHNSTCRTFPYIQLQLQQHWDFVVLAIVPNYCRMTSAPHPIMASIQSPAGWLILSLCISCSLSGWTYLLLSCSKQQSTGLRSGLDPSCRCPGRWGCAGRRRASWGSMWPADPRHEWNLVGGGDSRLDGAGAVTTNRMEMVSVTLVKTDPVVFCLQNTDSHGNSMTWSNTTAKTQG